MCLRDPTGLARTWQYPRKHLAVYIRAAPLIVNKLRLCFKHPRDLIPEWQRFSYVYYDCFTSRVSVEREKHVLSLPLLMNQRVGHHHASDVNAVIWVVTKHTLLTLTTPLTPVSHRKRLKDIQIFIHAAADPERATQTVFSTTHHYFCVTDI